MKKNSYCFTDKNHRLIIYFTAGVMAGRGVRRQGNRASAERIKALAVGEKEGNRRRGFAKYHALIHTDGYNSYAVNIL